MSKDLQLPDRINKIIRDHLQNEFGIEKIAFTIQSGSKNGDSYSGDVFRVIIVHNNTDTDKVPADYAGANNNFTIEFPTAGANNNSTLQFILKTIPENKIRRELHHSSKLFSREHYTYSNILPAFEKFQQQHIRNDVFKNYPKMITGSSERDAEFVLLQDLGTSGFENFYRPTPLNFQQCSSIFKILARLHAVSFAYKDQNPEEFLKLTEPLDEIVFKVPVLEEFDNFLKQKVDCAIRTLSNKDDREVIEHMLAFQEVFSESMVKCVSEKDAAVILHGDCWISNILYRNNPNSSDLDINFLDWQVTRYGTPAIDLSYFIFCCTDSELRIRLPELLRIYYSCLSKRITALGSDPKILFPLSKFEMHMKNYAKFGLGMALMTLHCTSCDPDEMPNVVEILERSDFEQLNEITETLIRKDAYVKRMAEVCRDMLRFGYI